jgi:TRAP-type mannitol/chloroaromatic compound transport system substrate-binding protein
MDSSMKFWEVAKYYYYPGLHEPGTIVGFGVNKAWYDSLPKGDQALVEACCVQTHFELYSEVNAKNGEWLNKFITEQGVELRKFNEDIIDAFGEAAEEVFEEVRQHSDLTKRIDDSFRASRATVANWISIAESEYFIQRNRVLGLGV